MHIGGRGPIHIYIEYREKNLSEGGAHTRSVGVGGTPKFFVGGKSDPRGQTKVE